MYSEAEPGASTDCEQGIWEETSGSARWGCEGESHQLEVCMGQVTTVGAWDGVHLSVLLVTRGNEAGVYLPTPLISGQGAVICRGRKPSNRQLWCCMYTSSGALGAKRVNAIHLGMSLKAP